ncbi:MAG: chemotaxis protein CheE [Alphaproteobacteria bacterium]|nr:chemotaxis protein CheE [Alphaproteobacteria bacterium]MBU2379560.1 chemotaxis protein CheE [Alphaproteobacteria bacterium]
MTQARTFKVKSSLAYKIKEPGGRLVRDAERMATEALNTHRDDVMANVATILDQLDVVCARKADDGGPQIYALAASMIDVAGFFDTGPLYDAAYSLCDISDRMIANDHWRWPAVQVHLQALRLILAGGCRTGRTSDMLLEGLRSVATNTR